MSLINQMMQAMMMATMTRTVMFQFDDTAMTRSSAMTAARSLDRQLNAVVPEMETTERDARRLLDTYGQYLKTGERGTLMEFLETLKLSSYMARRTKAITVRLKQEGITYPRD